MSFGCRDFERMTDDLRRTLPPHERVTPNGARLSVARYLARTDIFRHYTQEAARIARAEQNNHGSRTSRNTVRRLAITIQNVCTYLGVTPDEVFAAHCIAHTQTHHS